ncbi:MAG TPA: hypothetical protein PKZ74_08000, partial [Bacteroidales bacterium]|nr:hypothetical protein [Bacteroidales bacterium]
VYKDGLKDNEASRKALLKMMERFPANKHELISYYYLYKTYLDDGFLTEADFYKDQIIYKYPESDYARVLSDPEYYARIEAEKNKVNLLYAETFRDYKAGQYFQVIAKSDLAFTLYGDTMELAPNFAYLKAISVGKIDVLDSLILHMKKIIRKYPKSEVKTLAQNVLATLAEDNPEIKAETREFLPDEKKPEETLPEKASPYKVNPTGQHMFMIVADSKEMRLNPFKVKLSDFNTKYFSIEDLKINSLVLDNEHYVVTVGNFSNAQKARDYFDLIVINEYVYADLKAGTFFNFVISTENYSLFFKEKDIGGYSTFFEKNYNQ